MFFIYILRSLKTKRFYSGHCDNLENRLNEHNSGESKSTLVGVPWELVFSRKFKTRAEAMQEERKIKARGALRYLEDLHRVQPG